ncbi:hypothetical protein EJB05_33110, partial [Eragrostis curvula]
MVVAAATANASGDVGLEFLPEEALGWATWLAARGHAQSPCMCGCNLAPPGSSLSGNYAPRLRWLGSQGSGSTKPAGDERDASCFLFLASPSCSAPVCLLPRTADCVLVSILGQPPRSLSPARIILHHHQFNTAIMDRRHPGSKISSSCSSELTDGKLEERPNSALRSCPSCGHEIDCNTDMIGMPAGVKFDPSDMELIHHLQTMVDDGGSRAHPLIDEFIPTIQGEGGICYTHPENLPGVTRDGFSKHFFHRSSKAYTNGTRKRRKIHAQRDLNSSDNAIEMRWHKTGKTRPVIVGGRQKGCKKILVLYTNFGKNRKPEKTNWVMHQYHLGDQEEKDGELVVSKVFYQTQTRQHTATVAAATAEQRMMNCDKVAETSEAVTTTSSIVMMQQQQRRTNQADGQFSVAHSMKRRHEMMTQVDVGDQETSDEGEQNDNHNIPPQHQEEKQQQKEVERRFAGLEELIQGASTQSETQRPYRYWPPDRNQDQHG